MGVVRGHIYAMNIGDQVLCQFAQKSSSLRGSSRVVNNTVD